MTNLTLAELKAKHEPEDPAFLAEQVRLESERIIKNATKLLEDGDDGAHWESDVVEAARWLFHNEKSLFQRLRSDLKKASKEAQITDWTKEVKQTDDAQEDSSKSGELVDLCQGLTSLFHDPSGECYASFQQNGHTETWPLGSKGFVDWLSFRAYNDLGFVPADTALKAAIVALRGIATHDGEEHSVFLRCAPWRTGYIIDLTNTEWQAVEVLPTGWRVLTVSPVKFIRSQTSKALPLPVSGDPALLWNYVNCPPAERTLVLAFILDSWRPDTPYPVLFITGEQGSGKSCGHKNIRQVSDPNTVPLRTAPKNVEDVFVSAGANHQASFENMSNLTTALQDAFCTLATGGGFATRLLYSNAEESVIEVKRPVIINGISDVVTRPDLIDRMIHINFQQLEQVVEEQDFEERFERDRAPILGGLLDLFVKVLVLLPEIQLTAKPRMIGFTKLGEAVHKAQGIKGIPFTDLYLSNRKESLARSMDSSPAATAVQVMMEKMKDDEEWTGTVKELKSLLDAEYRQDGEGWPKSAKGLSDVLRRMAPSLISLGVNVEFLGRKRDGWHLRISPNQINISGNNVHHVHTFTETAGIDQNLNNPALECEHVNMVNVKSEKKKQAEEDTCSAEEDLL